MSVDRLQEMRKRKRMAAGGGQAVEMQPVIKEEESQEQEQLQHGDADVDLQKELYRPIESLIQNIRQSTELLDALRGKDNKTSTEDERKKISKQVLELNSKTMSQANSVKDALVKIKEMNDEFAKEPGNENSARAQIRDNLYQSTCRRFREHLAEFTEARENFKRNTEKRMVRNVQMVDSSISDDKAMQLVQSGGADAIITKALASDNMREVVQDLRIRQQELLALQRNVETLYQMFQDLYNLIEMNGESINIIEARVARSLDYVQRGEQELVKAKHHQKKAGKLKCILLVILLVVFIIVLTPILITSKPGASAGGEG